MMRTRSTFPILLFLIVGLMFYLMPNVKASNPPTEHPTTMADFLNCLHDAEASRRYSPPDGDNGASIGPFQIQRPYWIDATQYDKSIGGTYQDCRDYDYAKKVVIAYMKRYAKGKSWEQMARIHNGGPKGHRKTATDKYWRKSAFDPIR